MSANNDVQWHFELPVALLTAIGRVAHETALFDAMLTEFVGYLADSDSVGALSSGQTTDWLVQTCRLLLEEADPYQRHFPASFHSRVNTSMARATELRPIRNRVIHGTWSNLRFHERPLGRPFGGSFDGEVYWVARDRQRRAFEEQAMTVSDVDELADAVRALTADVIRAWREQVPHEPDWPPFRRWHDIGNR